MIKSLVDFINLMHSSNMISVICANYVEEWMKNEQVPEKFGNESEINKDNKDRRDKS